MKTISMPQRRLGHSTFVAYSPLGRGFLTGRFRSPEDFAPDDCRRGNPRFQGENFARNLALTTTIQHLARVKNCTPAQLALAWLLSRRMDVIPIPESTRAERVEEIAAAVEVRLSNDDLVLLDTIAPAVAGTRYPEGGMRAVNR